MKLKGFFDRPEGKTGMMFIGLGIFGFLVAGNTVMPYVITALQNTLHAALLGGTLLGITALVMNNKFRMLCSNIFKSSMRALTGLFITIDPIGILKNYIEDMKDRIDGIETNIQKLKAQMGNLKRTIDERNGVANDAMRMAQAAKKQGKNEKVHLYTRKAARAKEFINKLSTTLEKMEFLYKILDKMKRNVDLLLEDTKDEVETKEIEYKSIKAAHKAMSGAEKLINGDAQRELFEQSMEFIAEDIGMKLGEMERFMDVSQDFMDNVDLQNGVWDEKGMKMLEQWEQEGSLLSYDSNRGKEHGLSNNFEPPKVRVESPAVSSAEFGDFFNSNNNSNQKQQTTTVKK